MATMTDTGDRPFTLPLPAVECIPIELRERPQWVAVRFLHRQGKRTKVPVNPHTGRNAKVDDPMTWGTYGEANAFARRHGLMIGYIFTADDPYTGLDKDGCRDAESGALSAETFILLGHVPTFTEASVSGTGIHLIARATKPGPRCRRQGGDLEIYDRARLFVFTGRHIAGTPRAIMDCQNEVAALYDDLFPAPEPTPSSVDAPPPCSLDDAALLDLARGAKHGAKFSALYDAGDWQGQNYASHSEARQALCGELAFWTRRDEGRIEDLFQRSALYRADKWPRERERVLANAMQRKDVYQGSRPAPAASPPPPPSTVDAPPGACVVQEQIIADLRAQLAERDAKIAAMHDLFTAKGMTPQERCTAYQLSIEGASALSRKAEDDPDPLITIRPATIAENVGVSRQSVIDRLKKWDEWGHLHAEVRPSGETSETAVRLPATRLVDLLTIASSWTRPAGTPHVGGAGKRCPDCGGEHVLVKIETATVRTRTTECRDCGRVHAQRSKKLPGAITEIQHRSWDEAAAEDAALASQESPPVEDLRKVQTQPAPATDRLAAVPPPSSVDAPPRQSSPATVAETPRPAWTPPPAAGDGPRATTSGYQPCAACARSFFAVEGHLLLCGHCRPAWLAAFPRPGHDHARGA